MFRPPVCPAFLVDLRSGLAAVDVGQLAAGGACASVKSVCQACCQGQLAGSLSRIRRADLTIRAGMLISWALMVRVVAWA